MSEYLIHCSDGTELYHVWGIGGWGRGREKKGHKYIARVQINGKWRYFYSQREFDFWKKHTKDGKNFEDEQKKEYARFQDTQERRTQRSTWKKDDGTESNRRYDHAAQQASQLVLTAKRSGAGSYVSKVNKLLDNSGTYRESRLLDYKDTDSLLKKIPLTKLSELDKWGNYREWYKYLLRR